MGQLQGEAVAQKSSGPRPWLVADFADGEDGAAGRVCGGGAPDLVRKALGESRPWRGWSYGREERHGAAA